MARWETGTGIVEFPSGRRIRCRAWTDSLQPVADLTVLLTNADMSDSSVRPPSLDEAAQIVTIDWADGRLPRRPANAQDVLRDALLRSDQERVELVGGGSSRIGASLAVMGIQDGLGATEAIDWVGRTYSEGAIDSHALRAFIKELDDDRRTDEASSLTAK